MTLLKSIGAGVSLSVALAACVANSGPKYPDVTSFCNAFATAECSSAVVLDCAVPSASVCVANRQQICVTGQPPGSTYEPQEAEACVDAVTSAYADAELTMAETAAISQACAPVFDGPGGRNATCQSDADCMLSAGYSCVLAPASAVGMCEIPFLVSGGGSCATAESQCVEGYHCGVTQNCDINAAAGDPCSTTMPCGTGLECMSAGTCQAQAADGSACTTDEDCLHGICNKGSTQTTGLCVSEVTLSPDEPFCVDSR